MSRTSTPSTKTVPGGGFRKRDEQTEQRGLAGARPTDDGRRRARREHGVDVVEHHLVAVGKREIPELYVDL